MKPAPFFHHEPSTVRETVALLAEVAPMEGRILAGGQSLIPAMALRLARPLHLVDINRVQDFAGLAVTGEALTIGACVRHAAFHRPVVEGPLGELLARVSRHIAHYPVRTRGTFCGSLANADPASEWCLTAVTLEGVLVASSIRGTRLIPAVDFLRGIMSTALEPDEFLVEARLPLLPRQIRFGFSEFSRRAGDFAQAMALATMRIDTGVISDARLGIGGVEAAPRRVGEAETRLLGRAPTSEAFGAAAEAAAAAVMPIEDSPDAEAYKRDLVRATSLRALRQCVDPNSL